MLHIDLLIMFLGALTTTPNLRHPRKNSRKVTIDIHPPRHILVHTLVDHRKPLYNELLLLRIPFNQIAYRRFLIYSFGRDIDMSDPSPVLSVTR